MNAAHFHLMVNHLPIIFPIVGAMVILFGLLFKSDILKRMAYFIFIVGTITTFFAMNSGEGAEEIVEHMPGADHQLIHEHEEVAEIFALLSYAMGLLSLISLVISWRKHRFAKFFGIPVFLFSLLLIFFGKTTGTSGGEISHPEIRKGYVAGQAEVDNANEQQQKVDNEEDDFDAE